MSEAAYATYRLFNMRVLRRENGRHDKEKSREDVGWITKRSRRPQFLSPVTDPSVSETAVRFRRSAIYSRPVMTGRYAPSEPRSEADTAFNPLSTMTLIRVAVDAMGGDDAPRVPVEGACLAARSLGVAITLVGKADLLDAELQRICPGLPADQLTIVDSPEWIEMGESPASALRTKKRASVVVAASLVASGEAHAVVSAGNSGAAMGAAVLRMGTLPGVERPAIAIVMPTKKGEVVFMDAGATVDCSPKNLLQFAHMGAAFARSRLKADTPRVGLLGIGEEPTKGNSLTRGAYELLQESNLNFAGNIEPKEVFAGAVDVIICDGFVGNIALKVMESFLEFGFGLVAQSAPESDTRTAVMSCLHSAHQRLDWAEYGGALLLGVKGLCIISHGRSTSRAIAKAIQVGKEAVENDIIAALT